MDKGGDTFSPTLISTTIILYVFVQPGIDGPYNFSHDIYS